MKNTRFLFMALLSILFIYSAEARTKLSDNKVKITEQDTDKKKILLVTDLPENHSGGYLDVELRVSKGGPNVMYSLQFEGVERAFGSINRDTPAERIHLAITPQDVQVQMYFWYTSGIGVCEVRVIVYLDEESGSELSGWGPGGPPPSGIGFHAPTTEEDTGPGAVSPGEPKKETGKPATTGEKGGTTTTSPGKALEPEKNPTIGKKETTTTKPAESVIPSKPAESTTPTKPAETKTTIKPAESTTTTTDATTTKKPVESTATTTETKKTTETTTTSTPPEPQPPGEEPDAPGSE